MKYCPYCGADVPDGTVLFCVECGKELPAKQVKVTQPTTKQKSPTVKNRKAKASPATAAELLKAYNDGYDGYYEDLLPDDYGKERFETDSTPVKKIIILLIGVLVMIGICVLMLYLV